MQKISILILFIPLIIFSFSCTKDLSSLNNDPKNPLTVPSGSLLVNGEKNFSDALNSTANGVGPFRVLTQSWTENTYVSEARYILSASDAPSGWWNAFYSNTPGTAQTTSILNSLNDAKIAAAKDVTDQAVLRNDLIITDILEVFGYSILVNTYGNVPYVQALKDSIPFPAYDDAKTIYYDLLHRLDTAIAGLNPNAASWGSYDQIYGGDIGQWKKFAATLQLKLATVVADVDPATYSKYVLSAVNAGVFQSNTDNAIIQYQSSPTGNTNPAYQTFITRHDYSPANLIINTMLAWNDPRLTLFYTQFNGQYVGGIPGAGNGYVKFSQFSSGWLDPLLPGDLLDYSETEFLLAEAVERGISVGGTAESHYDKGITASILSWGGSATDASDYLTQPAVAYATAAGDWKQKIGYQQWLAFANQGWNAWTSIRRLGYPDIDNVNPPVGANGNLPRRFYYPNNEETSNSVNWANAVEAVSGGTTDDVATNLWWEKQ